MDSYRMDGHKLLWHLDRVRQWQEGRQIVPVYMEISPVSYCNHRCIFCGVDFAMTERHKLDTQVMVQRLEEMGRLGVRSLMFAGEGEPLLHEDLGLLLATAKRAGMDVSVTSNGSLGNRERWQEILPSLTWIRFSVDAGSPRVHAKVHGVAPKVFEQTVASIGEALAVRREQGLPVTIGVQYLVLPANLDDLGPALDLFSGLGVDYVALKPFSLHPQMIKKMDVDYQGLIDRVEEQVNQRADRHGTKVIFRRGAMTNYLEGALGFKHCRALPFWAYVASTGDVYTCSVFLGDPRFRAGNLNQETMEEIMLGQERRRSLEFGRQELDVEAHCRVNCRMARINEFLETLDNPPQHVNFI